MIAEEIIKTTVEIALSGICVYAGAAIYNWGYRNGLNVMDKKITELEERNRNQRAKINELYEDISRDYCSNPFRGIPNEGVSAIGPDTARFIKEHISIDKNHLKQKARKKPTGSKGKTK